MTTSPSSLSIAASVARVVRATAAATLGGFRRWPNRALLIDEPLALAEARTSRLRNIYWKTGDLLWDGNAVFRDAVAKHGGIQLSHERRVALSHLIGILTWGELAAWTVSAELAERLPDPDARMAASGQVFDEARHFYVLRDYLALLHVPVPRIDPYFASAARTLLGTRDLTLKLFAMQILVEGTAQAIFAYLGESGVEPVLSEILPYIERDEARHIGLGILHLPARLAGLTQAEQRRLSKRIHTIGDLLAATQMNLVEHYRALGLEPRDLLRRADGLLTGLAEKLGRVPGTDHYYFPVDDPRDPSYEAKLPVLLPLPGTIEAPLAHTLRKVVAYGARAIPA